MLKKFLFIRFWLAAFSFGLLFSLNFFSFAQGYKPFEAVQKMAVPEGFKVQLVASEPQIAQPVCIQFDNRGRLWVIQYLQYPNPAGLNRAKVDRFSRTTYDRVPEPPPRGPKGADRITILSDFDKNGRAQKAKDFVSGLSLATALEFGHGGVFVLQVPYLLFYPDKNGDDIPDSDPEVLLTGFGMEDAASVANHMAWGPDGWLYGCQGSCVTANIRGIEFQQGVWRYHPLTKRFELFMEGGGNEWGLDFDEDGNLILSTNFGGYRMMHGVQGGYFWKSFGKHGALHNPYAYGFFDHVPYKNFTGGHVDTGGIIYQGDSFPEKFRGKFIANDLLGHCVQWHNMEKSGSTFTASYGGELLTANDTWFAPCDLTMGPDGALYVADWSDKRTAHPDPDADWDRSNGRIYRVGADVRRLSSKSETNQILLTSSPTNNLANLSSAQLIELLGNKNDWFVRKARNVLAERRDVTVYPKLRGQIFETENEHLSLESLWALYTSGGADESFLNDLLEHRSSKIRYWAVRLLGDETKVSTVTAEHLLKISENETDVRVRSQLASTAKRLPATDGLAIAQKIAVRNLDAQDLFIPLLLWWAVEKHSVEAVDETIEQFVSGASLQSSIVRETILPRLMRRYAAEGSEKTLAACAHLLKTAPEKEHGQMLVSLEQGVREQKQVSKFEKLPASLQTQLTSLWNNETKDEVLLRLLVRVGYQPAWNRALSLAKDSNSPNELRVAMLQLIGESANPSALDVIRELSALNQPEPIQLAALGAMQQIPNAQIDELLKNYSAMTPTVRSKARDVFLSRKPWAAEFLKGVDAGRFKSSEIPVHELQKIATFDDKGLNELVRKQWGNIGSGTPEEKLADIRRFNNDLRAFPGDAKNGRELFLKSCAQCHELFGDGEKVGPELTHANRADKDFLLTSIVDPNAVVRKEFINYNVETSDGRTLNGLIVEQSANNVTMIGAKNEKTIIPRDKIRSMQESTVSLMPEGLLHGLKPQELRDLFAYLQSAKPLAAIVDSSTNAAISSPSSGERVGVRASKLEPIKISGKNFVMASSGKKFTPLGFNYDRDYKMRLLEDYWESEWQTVVEDFQEMKQLGATVVRIHLQFGKFMEAEDKPNEKSLAQLKRLVRLAEESGLYLDLTGLACYRKADVPVWFDLLTEEKRWAAQANFWEAIAKTCANSPAIFCYDLMNEPVIPAKTIKEWLMGHLGGFYYGQAVTLDAANRKRSDIARAWIGKLVAAIHKHDKNHLITVGLLPFEGPEFVKEIAPELDFISVHIYPKSGKLDEDLKTLKKFSADKPVVIEEMFPMNCNASELLEFIKKSQPTASGWIGFYWGQTLEELRASTKIGDAFTREWLKVFGQINQ